MDCECCLNKPDELNQSIFTNETLDSKTVWRCLIAHWKSVQICEMSCNDMHYCTHWGAVIWSIQATVNGRLFCRQETIRYCDTTRAESKSNDSDRSMSRAGQRLLFGALNTKTRRYFKLVPLTWNSNVHDSYGFMDSWICAKRCITLIFTSRNLNSSSLLGKEDQWLRFLSLHWYFDFLLCPWPPWEYVG